MPFHGGAFEPLVKKTDAKSNIDAHSLLSD
jgi:hypothetical protein